MLARKNDQIIQKDKQAIAANAGQSTYAALYSKNQLGFSHQVVNRDKAALLLALVKLIHAAAAQSNNSTNSPIAAPSHPAIPMTPAIPTAPNLKLSSTDTIIISVCIVGGILLIAAGAISWWLHGFCKEQKHDKKMLAQAEQELKAKDQRDLEEQKEMAKVAIEMPAPKSALSL